VNLPARTVHLPPAWCAIGANVRATAPTCLDPIDGVVAEVDGYTVIVHTDTGMAIAVDIEDCQPAA